MTARSIRIQALAAGALLLVAAGTSAETLYFKNKRTLEVSRYEIKGPLIYVTMQNGRTVYLRADSVDWEGTDLLKRGGYTLIKTSYESVDETAEGGVGGAPGRALTSTDLREAQGAARRRGAAPTMLVDVAGNAGWVDSRINVTSGQRLTLRASGTVRLSADVEVGPEGSAGGGGEPVVAGVPWGALVGRVGLAGTPFAVGRMLTLNAPASGRLFLGVNDGRLDDNSGLWSVRIEADGGATGAWGTAEAPGTTGAARGPGRALGFVGGVDRAREVRDQVQQER